MTIELNVRFTVKRSSARALPPLPGPCTDEELDFGCVAPKYAPAAPTPPELRPEWSEADRLGDEPAPTFDFY